MYVLIIASRCRPAGQRRRESTRLAYESVELGAVEIDGTQSSKQSGVRSRPIPVGRRSSISDEKAAIGDVVQWLTWRIPFDVVRILGTTFVCLKVVATYGDGSFVLGWSWYATFAPSFVLDVFVVYCLYRLKDHACTSVERWYALYFCRLPPPRVTCAGLQTILVAACTLHVACCMLHAAQCSCLQPYFLYFTGHYQDKKKKEKKKKKKKKEDTPAVCKGQVGLGVVEWHEGTT